MSGYVRLCPGKPDQDPPADLTRDQMAAWHIARAERWRNIAGDALGTPEGVNRLQAAGEITPAHADMLRKAMG